MCGLFVLYINLKKIIVTFVFNGKTFALIAKFVNEPGPAICIKQILFEFPVVDASSCYSLPTVLCTALNLKTQSLLSLRESPKPKHNPDTVVTSDL